MKASPNRPTRALVDLDAIVSNIKQVQSGLREGTKVFAVVKANAYGHGAVAVSRYLESDVDAFCVSNIDEALELRQAGIRLPILVLGVTDWQKVDLAKSQQISLTIASEAWVDQALSAGCQLQDLDFHIKIDSGMGRIGFRQEEELASSLAKLKQAGARFEGIFTHFATADEADQSKLYDQYARFQEILASLEERPALVHLSNSAASIWHGDLAMDAVRLGDVIYGMNPSGTTLELPYSLKPAMQLETEMVHVKLLEKGAQVGYGASYETEEDQYIATLPLGYADGWTRDMQGYSVLVEGRLCPIVGRVSMDQITIRLPKAYPLGTKVVLMGKSGDQSISATDVALYRGTINYEVLCLISDRVARVYKGEGYDQAD